MKTKPKTKKQLSREARWRRAAKDNYGDVFGDDIKFDPEAEVREANEGAWVAAWIWVQS